MIPRLGQQVDIYDEFECFALNVFRHELKKFRWEVRSSGTVDIQPLYPWEDLEFYDKGAVSSPHEVSGIIKQSSDVFFARSLRFNGFQQGHTDQSLQIMTNTKEARLIVDVSDIPMFEEVFTTAPVAFLCNEAGEKPIKKLETTYPGVYTISVFDLKEDDVIRMQFSVDWSKVSRA